MSVHDRYWSADLFLAPSDDDDVCRHKECEVCRHKEMCRHNQSVGMLVKFDYSFCICISISMFKFKFKLQFVIQSYYRVQWQFLNLNGPKIVSE
jgi:hypothetical protein